MELFEVPSNWEFKYLSLFVATIESGSRPRGGVSKYTSGIPSISAEQIDADGNFYWEKIKYVPDDFYENNIKGRIQKNDILVVKDGATTGKSAFINSHFPFEKSIINEHTFIVRTRDELNPKFAFYYLRSPYCIEYFESSRLKGVIGGITNTFINDILIPIPPLSEQNRIVTRIDKLTRRVQEIRRLRREAATEAALLMQERIDKLLTGLTEKFFPLRHFLIDKPRNGWSPPGNSFASHGVPVLTLSAVTGFNYEGSKIKWTSSPTRLDAHYWLKLGELLITRSNTPELVGHAAIYDGKPAPCICPDLIMKMTVDPAKADTRFVHFWLQASIARIYLMTRARGTSGSMKKINQGHVEGIPVPGIPVEQQRRIVEYLNGLQGKADDLKRLQAETEAELAAFTPALLAKAFRGDL
jgi:type I restriction enzyme S subunit